MKGNTFDAGGLIALDRNDRRVLALVARATERGMRITIPATALAQAIRNPAKQARLSKLICQAATDGRHRRCPRRDLCVAGRPAVVTSEADDLRRIAPTLPLVVL